MTSDIVPNLDRLIIHQFDPARPVPGGIDTCLRGMCKFAPRDQKIGIIGVDAGISKPSRDLGSWELHRFGDREVWFMPVTRLDPADQRRMIPHSLRLVAGLLRYRSRVPHAPLVQAHRMDTAVAVKLLTRKPLTYCVHTQAEGLTNEASDSVWKHAASLHRKLEEWTIRNSSKTVVFNPDYAASVTHLNQNVVFSPTWYDPDLIVGESTNRDPFQIVWVGRMEYPKDPLLAVDVFDEIIRRDESSPWSLNIAGSGTLFDETQSKVQSLGLERRVRLHGRLDPDAVAKLMGESGVFLMTSRAGYEGFPRVLVEAMASGAVPIVTPGADTGSLVSSGLNGWAAHSRDPEAIADLVLKARECAPEKVVETVRDLRADYLVPEILQIGK